MRYRAKSSVMKSQRVLCGYTQKDLAQALGTYQPNVSQLEAGRTTVTRERAGTISRLLRTSVGMVFEKCCPNCGRIYAGGGQGT